MGDESIRKVRAPRFSDAEWRRLEAQLLKVRSSKSTAISRKLMTAHEFVWAVTMLAVRLLEEVPKGDKPYDLHEVLRGPNGHAPVPAAVGTRKTQKAARSSPVWEGAKLTNGDLGLELDWPQLPKPSGEPPPELVPAMLKHHREKDMRLCPVEKVVLAPQAKGRRTPPGYGPCCVCEWAHALPHGWPLDDGGVKLEDEAQRTRLEEAKARARKGEKQPPACAGCDDTGAHRIDGTPCEHLFNSFRCAMCQDTGFYGAGTTLHPCHCPTGRGLVAKGHPETNCESGKLTRKQRAEAQHVALEAVAGTPLDPRRGKAEPKPPTGSSDEFYTPSKIFRPLHEEFSFTLDACATAESAKCTRYYTKDQDGLVLDWSGDRVWCNPPYSPGNLAAWVKKCTEEAGRAELIVALLPAWTDRAWFHEFIERPLRLQEKNPDRLPFTLEVRHHKGRIAFGFPGNPEGKGGGTGTFPSIFVIWRRR